MEHWNRRDTLVGLTALVLAACRRTERGHSDRDGPPAELLEVLSFLEEDSQAVGDRQGVGLDGRLAYDHSVLRAESDLVTPTEAFFVRTFQPTGLDTSDWSVELPTGLLTAAELASQSVDQGVVLLECSGNGANRHFGLISAAAWSGVKLTDLLAPAGDPLIEVDADDSHPEFSSSSTPGASWIYRWSDLSDAFLATGMNDAPLTPDHGAPVRLVVPGWYGCASPKWVRSVRIVPEDTPATSQMREFASRTHQIGTPALAADYRPARAEASAMVVQVERWSDGTLRVYAIAWGARSGSLDLHVGDTVFEGVFELSGAQETWEVTCIELDESAVPTGPQTLRFTAPAGVPAIRLDARTYDRRVAL